MRILVVEDEALVAMEVAAYLEAAGHEVVGLADDAQSALGLARSASPDLAFVDIQLANGDSGLAVAAELKAMGVPSFFATGTCPRDHGRGLALGCIHKPFDARALATAVSVAGALLTGTLLPPVPAAFHLY